MNPQERVYDHKKKKNSQRASNETFEKLECLSRNETLKAILIWPLTQISQQSNRSGRKETRGINQLYFLTMKLVYNKYTDFVQKVHRERERTTIVGNKQKTISRIYFGINRVKYYHDKTSYSVLFAWIIFTSFLTKHKT